MYSLQGFEALMRAVFFDDPDLVPVETLRSRACSAVAAGLPLAPPLEEMVLRGGLYARLRYCGPYADMKGAYRWLLGYGCRNPVTNPMTTRSSKPISTTRSTLRQRTL